MKRVYTTRKQRTHHWVVRDNARVLSFDSQNALSLMQPCRMLFELFLFATFLNLAVNNLTRLMILSFTTSPNYSRDS